MRRSSATYVRALVASLALVPATACTSPNLTSLAPSQGPARSLVAIQGTSGVVRVLWDVGTPNQRTIATNVGGTLFSVPPGAAPGVHKVAIEDDSGQSEAMDFLVGGEALAMGAPRIDHVMLLDAEFDGGDVSFTLYVQGANFDVGAVVEIDEAEIATTSHKAITNDLYGVSPNAFARPIHQYLSLAAVPGARAAGSDISIVVRNADDVESAALVYTLPTSADLLDSDGDRLLDAWEVEGHDQNGDGVNDADPHRRDIFVELDVMIGLTYPLAPTTGADPGVLDAVRSMFQSAPFLNPYVGNGINLMLDSSGTVPQWDTVIFNRAGATGNPADGMVTVDFTTLKAAHFGHSALGDVYHYVIWARRQLGGGSGQSDAPWPVPDLQAGDDALITLDDLHVSYQSPRSQAEILAHELGHNLGQKHGGATDTPYNPNYLSVMSYAWALRTGGTDVERRLWATCLPFYYAKAGADEPANKVPVPVNMVVDYSTGMAAPLMEDALDETAGVCAQTVDWDEDGDEDGVGSTILADDANENSVFHETIEDFPNWSSLRFDGPLRNGTMP